MWHKSIMRTTVDLPEHLLVEAKKLAAAQHRSLASILSESLRQFLASSRRQSVHTNLVPLPIIRDAVLVANIDLNDTSALLDLE